MFEFGTKIEIFMVVTSEKKLWPWRCLREIWINCKMEQIILFVINVFFDNFLNRYTAGCVRKCLFSETKTNINCTTYSWELTKRLAVSVKIMATSTKPCSCKQMGQRKTCQLAILMSLQRKQKISRLFKIQTNQ